MKGNEEVAREIVLQACGVSPDEHRNATCDLTKLRGSIAAALAAREIETLEWAQKLIWDRYAADPKEFRDRLATLKATATREEK